MSGSPEVRRETTFFPGPNSIMVGTALIELGRRLIINGRKKRLQEIAEDAIELNAWFFTPFFSETRKQGFRNIYYEHNHPEKCFRGLKDDYVYRPYYISAKDVNQWDVPAYHPYASSVLMEHYGLALRDEVNLAKDGENVEQTDWKNKYFTWSQLQQQVQQDWTGKTIGIFHGSFDPPHPGHAQAIAAAWPYCDIMLIGFDDDQIISRRKTTRNDKRPRYKDVIPWKMREFAHLPTVDGVFKMPLINGSSEEYQQIYEQLNIKILATGINNPMLPTYQADMRRQGGYVVTSEKDEELSSTILIQLATYCDKVLLPFDWEEKMHAGNEIALGAGFGK